jgi:hypothetical protein
LDSRQYIFIYPLRTSADVPADFPQEFRSLAFETGIFLPQDDAGWFTRPPQYPARLLLLEGRYLYIVPHPTSGQSPVKIELDYLLQLETGSVLLLGWIELTTPHRVHRLIYNTRGSGPLEAFLGMLKRRWFENIAPLPRIPTNICGDELDIKFKNSVWYELDRDEAALAQYFQAPLSVQKSFLFFKRKDWRAGNLVLLTSMNRLVWITDEYRHRREPYASISYSVPCFLLQSCTIENKTEERPRLAISFNSGFCWYIPLFRSPDECSSFCARLTQVAAWATRDHIPQPQPAKNAARPD